MAIEYVLRIELNGIMQAENILNGNTEYIFQSNQVINGRYGKSHFPTGHRLP